MATRGGYQREGERRERKCGKEEIFFIRDLLTYTKRDGKNSNGHRENLCRRNSKWEGRFPGSNIRGKGIEEGYRGGQGVGLGELVKGSNIKGEGFFWRRAQEQDRRYWGVGELVKAGGSGG